MNLKRYSFLVDMVTVVALLILPFTITRIHIMNATYVM